MSRIRFQSKANGMLSLRRKWLKAMAIMLLITVLILGFGSLEMAYRAACGVPVLNDNGSYNISPASLIIEAVFTLLVLLFIPPLITGQTEWYWHLTEGEGKGIGEVFGWFGSLRLYFRSVLLALNLFVRFALWFVATCAVPVGLMVAVYYYFPPKLDTIGVYDSTTLMFGFLMFFCILLLLCCVFLLCFIMMRYFLAVFLLVEDDSRKIRETVRLSVQYSRRLRWEMLKFQLSFLPWLIFCYFVLPALFVLPYYFASSAVFAKHIIYSQRAREKARTGENQQAEVTDR